VTGRAAIQRTKLWEIDRRILSSPSAVCRCYALCPKNTGRQNDQRRHKASHLAFPLPSALQQQHRPAGRLRFFVRECSLFAGDTVDHLIGSRVRGMSPGSALLSWRDLRSTPDRRSPVSCFSFSDRVSVPDRRSFEARLSSPDRLSSLPIVVSVGCRESCWIAQDYRTKAAREVGYLGRLVSAYSAI
jgi:hypothetical protein